MGKNCPIGLNILVRSRDDVFTTTQPPKEEETMATKQYKQLGCLDVQPSGGCGFQVRAETEAELMQLVATHAKQCHKLESLPQEMVTQVKAAIKTVPVTV
jgi:predicted small metal-binding protein